MVGQILGIVLLAGARKKSPPASWESNDGRGNEGLHTYVLECVDMSQVI